LDESTIRLLRDKKKRAKSALPFLNDLCGI
jgi:hypothetical protein